MAADQRPDLRNRPNMAVEPLAMCYAGLVGGTVRGRPTPRFRTIQVYPKDLRALPGLLSLR